MRVPDHVINTVESLAQIHARAEAGLSPHQRGVESMTKALGSARGVYVIVSLVAVWMGVNEALLLGGLHPFDPAPFPLLQGLVSLAALLATVMVLTTQNRQTRYADERSRLDLEVNLLTETKIAKVIALLEELRHDLPNVRNRVDLVAEAMQETVDPHEVLSALTESLERSVQMADGGEAAKPDES